MLTLSARPPALINILTTSSKSLPLEKPKFSPPNPKQFRLYAQNGNNKAENGINNGEEGKVKNGKPFKLNLLNLVLDPDPENVLAVGLTGVLTWASVQVLWQLLVVTATILISAVKYSVVAALLIFILITLL